MRMVSGSRPHARHSVRMTYRPSPALGLLGSLRISHNKFLQANKWILILILILVNPSMQYNALSAWCIVVNCNTEVLIVIIIFISNPIFPFLSEHLNTFRIYSGVGMVYFGWTLWLFWEVWKSLMAERLDGHHRYMKCTVMIWRLWVRTLVGLNLGCVVLVSKSNLNLKHQLSVY